MEDCFTDERPQQEMLCHRQWTDEYVERPETLMRQNVVVVLTLINLSYFYRAGLSNKQLLQGPQRGGTVRR